MPACRSWSASVSPERPHTCQTECSASVAHHVVAVRERAEQDRGVREDADLAEPGGGAPARLGVGVLHVGQRLLPGQRGPVLGGHARDEQGGEPQQDGERRVQAPHARPTSLRKAASSSVGTFRRLASSALEPASSPTTT